MTLHVSLFGRFRIRNTAGPLTGFEGRKVQELFSYLLFYRDRSHSRDLLADIFWPDRSTPNAKKQLRQTLWQIQSALNPTGADTENPFVLAETDWILLREEAPLSVDVARFEQAYLTVQSVSGRDLNSPQADSLDRALSLYRGDLLEGWYHDWCIFERERLQNFYLTLLDKLLGFCEQAGQYGRGLEYGNRILRIDRARERTHRRLMRLHYLAGNRSAALRQYESCVDALHSELDVPPAQRTQLLHEQIRSESLNTPPPEQGAPGTPLPEGSVSTTAAEDPSSAPPPASFTDTLNELHQLQQVAASLQRKIDRCVRAVEGVVGK